jgi:hypothetical protein
MTNSIQNKITACVALLQCDFDLVKKIESNLNGFFTMASQGDYSIESLKDETFSGNDPLDYVGADDLCDTDKESIREIQHGIIAIYANN